jgi:uncharacterized protein (DUF1919 family)
MPFEKLVDREVHFVKSHVVEPANNEMEMVTARMIMMALFVVVAILLFSDQHEMIMTIRLLLMLKRDSEL